MKWRLQLRGKITAIVLIVVLAVLAVIVGAITYLNREESMEQARDLALSHSRELASVVQLEFERALDVARSLAYFLEGLGASSNLDRGLVNEVLAQTLRRNPHFFGIWTCWEPNAFDGRDRDFAGMTGHDGTGRFIPYWHRDGEKIVLEPLAGYDVPGDGDYYLKAMERGRETILEPYGYAVGSRSMKMTTLTVPVEVQGKRVGAVGVDIALDSIQEMTAMMKLYETGFGRLLTHKGIVASQPNRDRIGEMAGETQGSEGDEVLRRIARGESWFEEAWSPVLKQTVYKGFAPVEVGDTGTPWNFSTVIPKKEVLAAANRTLFLSVVLAGTGLLAIIVAVWLIAGRIVRPVKKVAEMAARAQGGDLTITREEFAIRSADELGLMADALASMVRAQAETVSQIRQTAEAVSETSASLAALSQETNASMEEVRGSLDQASELSESNGASIEETTASVQEMAGSAQTMARVAAEGSAAGAKAGTTASTSVEKVQAVVRDLGAVEGKSRESVEVMSHLATAVKDIAGFVDVISSIADQTNLLALNAAIEAARAGDAGRGFAVVAEEVRKLAEESNRAASEVSGLIGELEKSTRDSIAVTEEAGTIMKETVSRADEAGRELQIALGEIGNVIESIDSAAATSQEQAASSEEMAAAMDQISGGTVRISELIRSIGNASEETSKAAEGVARQAQEMSLKGEELLSQIARFKVGREVTGGLAPLASGERRLS